MLDKEYQDQLQLVRKFINRMITEWNSAWDRLNNSTNNITTLAMLSFCMMDVFATYWSLYQNNKQESNKTKMKSRISTFMLTEQNEHFMEFHNNYKNISSDDLYNLRCNTVHFFSCIYDKICISNGDERTLPPTITDHWIIISNMSLNLILYIWAQEMLNIILDKNNQSKGHKEWIQRIYDKIKKEWWTMIYLK